VKPQRVSGFGFRVLSFGFRFSVFGFRVPGLGVQVEGVESRGTRRLQYSIDVGEGDVLRVGGQAGRKGRQAGRPAGGGGAARVSEAGF